jgi:hypothetical protein
MCKFLYGHIFLFLLGMYLRMDFLNHVIILYLISERDARLFSRIVMSFYIHISSILSFQFLHILTNICYFTLYILDLAILVNIKWCLIVILICISLITNGVFSGAYRLVVFFFVFWRHVCSKLCPFFNCFIINS